MIIHTLNGYPVEDGSLHFQCQDCPYHFRLIREETYTRKETLVPDPDPVNHRHFGSTMPDLEMGWIDVMNKNKGH